MKTQISLILTIIMMIMLETKAISQENDQNLIDSTCKQTPNYQLCAATLRASPGSATADVAGLGLILVRAVEAKAKEALAAANKLSKSVQPKLSQAARRCAEVYNAVVTADVPEAVEALTKGDPKFAENGMADTVGETDTCDGAFVGVVAQPPSPLNRLNKDVRDLAGVARAITRILL